MAVKQLIKWIGNKTRYSDEIVSFMPKQINTYFEPFLGSGAVLATLLEECKNNKHILKNAVASDTLLPLIDIFRLIQNDPKKIIDYYDKIISRFNLNRDVVYNEIKESYNKNNNPYDFLILSRTCYSGVIRFRKSDGYMSTPIGPHKPIDPSEFEHRAYIWHDLLKNVNLQNCDFKETFKFAGEGDVIYCDPPYTHSQSILYGAQSFEIDELWKSIEEAKNRGAKIILSLNGKNKSKRNDISVPIPEGLFERCCYIDCGISMINRLQRSGKLMEDELVHDLLLLSW